MWIHVLGSAAGGGFPQWNCNCNNCAGLRAGTLKAHARTQSSICISANGSDWALINASPDIRAQLHAFPPIHPPVEAPRGSGIRGVVLIDSQIDHTTGLLTLRESHEQLSIHCTDMVRQDLTTGFPVLNMLDHYCKVDWQPIPDRGGAFRVGRVDGVEFEAVPLSSKAPPYSPHREDPHPGDNIGLSMTDTKSGLRAFYAPGLGEIEPHLDQYFLASDLILVDGTFWTEDEMSRAGVGSKPASAMGHLHLSGDDGLLAKLARYHRARKVLIHINNTNPMLVNDSDERRAVEAAGFEVAFDGMDLHLGEETT
jgi:pyrroloquinoline quinone biosynthesis protein B